MSEPAWRHRDAALAYAGFAMIPARIGRVLTSTAAVIGQSGMPAAVAGIRMTGAELVIAG